GSTPLPVIGRLCAFPELQFWRPITVRRRSRAAARTSSGRTEGAAALPGPDRRGTGARGRRWPFACFYPGL
ncbi:unnamed protein product, partial [Staurois parvus]